MSNTPGTKDESKQTGEDKGNERQTSPAEKQQQKTDPQLTELKGLTDPDEPIEVKGTDNPV